MIPVTKPYLPNREKLARYIDGIYERNWWTNNGPLLQELTRRLESYLGVDNLLLVSNGTVALQIAYRALGLGDGFERQEAVTTPFSFVATASSLKWEGVEPVFVDIDRGSWCLDPVRIEGAITPSTRVIVPVHVFGNACDVEAIDAIAERHGLRVIYDAAHAFSVTYRGESILKRGDAATLSFHATKVFHTIEGGAICFRDTETFERAKKMMNFGFASSGTIEELGINAKMNEFQAAVGLCALDEIEDNLKGRAAVWRRYKEGFGGRYQLQYRHPQVSNNYGYFPLLMDDEVAVLRVIDRLRRNGVSGRRYFYPSLDSLGFGRSTGTEVARCVAERILCLPVDSSLDANDQERIVALVQEA